MEVLISIRLFLCCAAVECNQQQLRGRAEDAVRYPSRQLHSVAVTTILLAAPLYFSLSLPLSPSLSLIIPQTIGAPVSHARRLGARINVLHLSPTLRLASTLL